MKKKTNRLDWDDWLESAKAYHEEFGDLLVPSRYVTPEGYKLGRWIERQRAIFNGNTKITGSLCLDQIAALNAIGMVWKLESRYAWDFWLNLCDTYIEENGNLLVPKAYMAENGVLLGNWIGEQRKKCAEGKLTEQQVSDLDARNMVWSLGKRRAWTDWFEDAKQYYYKYGNLLVPLEYKTPDGELLGQWIFSERDHRCRRENYSQNRVYLLDSIGMVWNLQTVRDDAWERMYSYIKAYIEEHGKLPLWPRGQLAPDGRKMDGWIAVQRTRLSNDKVPAWQKDKLTKIGIFPFRTSKTESRTSN